MSKSIKRPAFFKVFLEQFSSEMMEIPTAFCNNLINKKSKVVYLTDPNGNTWKMDLIKSPEKEGGSFLGGEGWMTFWKHHNIVTGDFLVFKFEGEINFKDVEKMDGSMQNVEDQWWFLKFKVKIFDPTYCEKKIAAKPFQSCTITDLVQLKQEEEQAVYVHPLAAQLPYHCSQEPASPVSFPFFVGLIKKRSCYMIDEEFKRQCLSEYGYSTQVVVSFGEDTSKEWSVTMVRLQDRDASMKIKKGWKKFAQDNHLRVGDMLRFEMVSHFHFHLLKLHPTTNQ